jgi:phospholipid-binding lipoprotein MlaA
LIVRQTLALVPLVALLAVPPAAALDGVALSEARGSLENREAHGAAAVQAPAEQASSPGAATEAHEEREDWEDPEWLFGEEYDDPADSDPLEPGNRAMFGLNEFVYRWMMNPVTDVYAFVVPRPVRRSVLRFFDNLGEPANLVNELLQLNPSRAGKTGTRFLVNTTVGVVGLFDFATPLGFEANHTDFGETLGAHGVGPGWYLVIPVLGPSSARDLFGDAVDSLLRPHVYVMGTYSVLLLATGGGITRYDHNRAQLEALRSSSVDFYAAMRSAYTLQRRADVRDARASSPVLADDTGTEEESQSSSSVPASAAEILASTAVRSASKPSRRSTPEYSERRSASSETVPLR